VNSKKEALYSNIYYLFNLNPGEKRCLITKDGDKLACPLNTNAEMSVSVDWKPEKAVQEKIRDTNKNDDYPDRLKTQKGDLSKS